MSPASLLDLPPEILLQIVKNLSDHPYALRNSSLACRSLLYPSRDQLFRYILLDNKTTQRFLPLIRHNPAIAGFVQELKISGRSAPVDVQSIPFKSFPRLRSLALEHLSLTIDDIFAILIDTPILATLECYTLLEPSAPLGLQQKPEGLGSPGTLPVLRSLVVKYGELNQDKFVERVLGMDISAVSSLRVAFGSTDQHLSWLPVIRASGASLRQLSIAMSDPSGDLSPGNPHALVLNALASASQLTCLALWYQPSRSIHYSGSLAFFESICGFFERSPPPVRRIAHLTLSAPDRGETREIVNEGLANRLAEALLDVERYPSLSRMDVTVRVQRWHDPWSKGGMWIISGIPDLDKHFAEKRWRQTFSKFANRSDLTFNLYLLDYLGFR